MQVEIKDIIGWLNEYNRKIEWEPIRVSFLIDDLIEDFCEKEGDNK